MTSSEVNWLIALGVSVEMSPASRMETSAGRLSMEVGIGSSEGVGVGVGIGSGEAVVPELGLGDVRAVEKVRSSMLKMSRLSAVSPLLKSSVSVK